MQNLPEPGTILEVTIDAVAHGGDGIGRVDGLACFVTGALPGDTVRARVYRRKPRAVWARLLSIESASPHRSENAICTETACAAACVWHNFAYPDQGAWKQRIVADTLQRIGGIRIEVGWQERQEYRLGYRTRAAFHGDGEKVGYYAQHTHQVIPLSACPLNHPRLNAALEALQVPGVRGDVLVTVNPEGSETLISLRDDIPAVRNQFPMTNTRGERKRFQFLFDGAPIVNGAFSQSSLLLNRMLREHTDDCAGTPASLLDLYCGNGNLSLHHIRNCEVLGVDHAGDAVDAAAALAPGAYARGDETVMARKIAARPWDVILLDPPRTGAQALVAALATARANRIVYVSCNPATLARDLSGIVSGGWQVARATVLDMFPHTPHMETVCVLERP